MRAVKHVSGSDGCVETGWRQDSMQTMREMQTHSKQVDRGDDANAGDTAQIEDGPGESRAQTEPAACRGIRC